MFLFSFPQMEGSINLFKTITIPCYCAIYTYDPLNDRYYFCFGIFAIVAVEQMGKNISHLDFRWNAYEKRDEY